MSAPRVTPQEIVEMHRLYAQLGTYAAVGRKLGRSGSTVAIYIQMKGVATPIRIAVQNLTQKQECCKMGVQRNESRPKGKRANVAALSKQAYLY